MRIKRQHVISHSARRRQLAVFEFQHMNQRVRIDVIEVVAGGSIRVLMQEKVGQVCVFSVVVNNIGNELPLLQQIRTSREIRYPRLRFLSPGRIPVEPLPEWPERESWLPIEQRLVN